jgi:imidazolonepropionase-like amidohydrolase
MITCDGEKVINDASICLDDNGKILDIGNSGELIERYPNAEINHYKDCTILPGLIDLHVHIGYWWNKPDCTMYNDGLVALLAAKKLQEALSLGVTTIRDVADPDTLCETLRYAKKNKFIISPRIFHSNMGIIMTGGHGWQLKGALREANGPWEMRAAVREQVKQGADWIKIMTSHRTSTPEFTQEELDAAVNETHRLGLKCCVHASLQPALEMAINAGFDTIEHGTFMTIEQAKKMVQKGIAWVPTMVTFFMIADNYRDMANKSGVNHGIINEEILRQGQFFIDSEHAYRENFLSIMSTGIKVATGTDIVLDKNPITPVADEVRIMVELGMNPIKAIQAATHNAAEILGYGDQFGMLKIGYLGDVLIVDGDPLLDISALKQVREVYLEGVSVFKRTNRASDCSQSVV